MQQLAVSIVEKEMVDGQLFGEYEVPECDYVLLFKKGFKVILSPEELSQFMDDGIVAYTCDEIRIDTLVYNQYYHYLLRHDEVGNSLIIKREHAIGKKIRFNREFLNSLIGIGPVSHIPKYVVQEQ